MSSRSFTCPTTKSLRRHTWRLGLTALLLALPLQLAAQDGEEEAMDLSRIKAELAKGKNGSPQREQATGSQGLNKEFQRLMAAEEELLNKMGRQPEAGNQVSADEELPPQLAEAESQELTLPQKAADQASPRVKKLPRVVPAVLENQEESEELNDLTMADPSDIQMEEKVEGQGQKLQKLQKQNSELKAQLEAAQRSAKDLRKELDETRNRLIMAETQVERLSNVIEDRNRSSLSRLGNTAAARQPVAQQSNAARFAAPPQHAEKQPADEMPVATVITDKAHLRTGPGKDNSPLMTVSKGTRLAIETRNGEWYRVISPTGARAWVSADVLAFGNGPSGRPSETRINRAFRASAPNDQASELTEPLEQR